MINPLEFSEREEVISMSFIEIKGLSKIFLQGNQKIYGFSIPPTKFKNVDFPDPLRPITDMKVPFSIDKFAFRIPYIF